MDGYANPHDFKDGRDFAASLGFVPRQHSTGGKHKLGGSPNAGMDIYGNSSYTEPGL